MRGKGPNRMDDNQWDEPEFSQPYMQGKTMKMLSIGGVVLVLIIIGAIFATLMGGNRGKTSPMKVLNNPFGQQAEQMGVKNCAALFSVLGETLAVNSQYSAQMIWHQKEADRHAVQSLVGQVYSTDNNISKGAGAVFAAPVNGGCEGMMVRTVLAPQSCTDIVKDQLPKGAERQNDLTETAVFRLPDKGYVMMIPASTASCVVVTALNLTDGQ